MGYNGVIASSRRTSVVDTEAPTAPSNVTMTPTCQTTGTISWSASTDNVAVTGYKIYKNGVELYDVPATPRNKAVTGLVANTSYNWTMKAYDAASNLSAVSNTDAVLQPPTVFSITLGVGEVGSGALACVQTINVTYYKTINSTITVGHTIYLDACATSVLNGGGQYWSNGTVSFTVSSSGTIGSINPCA